MDKFFKWVQEMYPEKNEQECLQQLEFLVKQDVIGNLTDPIIFGVKGTQIGAIRGSIIGNSSQIIDFAKDEQNQVHKEKQKFVPGDMVLVTEKLRGYPWKHMFRFIGKPYMVRRYNQFCEHEKEYGIRFYRFEEIHYNFPEDCLELI